MPSMKVTVSAAMRARDVSRPQPHHEAAAEEEVAAARPASPQRARTPLPPLRGTGPARVPAARRAGRTARPPAQARTTGQPSRGRDDTEARR